MLSFIRSDLAQLTAYSNHAVEHPEVGAKVVVQPERIDRIDANESPFDLPDDLKQKLAWTFQQITQSNRYPDGGYEALKGAIADYVNETAGAANFQATHISIGNGSDELIRSLLIATCLGGEGAALVAEPTFSMYGILAQTLGIPIVRVPRSTANFAVDVDKAQQAITETQAPPIRVVFMVHPNSPTGNALTDTEIDWLRNLPESVLVVIDEAYFEFSQSTLAAELAQRPNWVILRTFSKAFRLAAHRVGYAIAHPDLIAALEKVRLPYNLPSFTQAAALTALAHRQQLLESIPQMLSQREAVAHMLSSFSSLAVWPSVGNFIFVQSKDAAVNLSELYEQLKAQKTLVRHTCGGLRITIGTPEENQRFGDRLRSAFSQVAAS